MTESAQTHEPVTYLSRDMFADRLGEVFQAEISAGETLDLVLAKAVDQAGDRTAADRPASFSLEFRGPKEPILPQRIYTVEHSELGRLDIFMVPIGPDAKGMLYESVFNYDA